MAHTLDSLEGSSLELRSVSPLVGRGLFATQNIKAGQFLLAEEPLLLLDRADSANFENQATWAFLGIGFNSVNIMRLAKVLRGPTFPHPSMLTDFQHQVRRSNNFLPAFRMMIAALAVKLNANLLPLVHGGQEPVALCPILSHVNNACKPNAWLHWNPLLKRVVLRALVPINSDSEITIAYYAKYPFSTATLRQRELSRTYDFICLCCACTTERKQSDANRSRLDILNTSLIVFAKRWEAEVPSQFRNFKDMPLFEGPLTKDLAHDEYAPITMVDEMLRIADDEGIKPSLVSSW